jgi:acyl carrier protein
MNTTGIEIIQAIAEHLGLNPEDLDRHATLRDELGLGPIELNDLLSSLSQKFNVTFEPSEANALEKVEDLVSLVEDNLLD